MNKGIELMADVTRYILTHLFSWRLSERGLQADRSRFPKQTDPLRAGLDWACESYSALWTRRMLLSYKHV